MENHMLDHNLKTMHRNLLSLIGANSKALADGMTTSMDGNTNEASTSNSPIGNDWDYWKYQMPNVFAPDYQNAELIYHPTGFRKLESVLDQAVYGAVRKSKETFPLSQQVLLPNTRDDSYGLTDHIIGYDVGQQICPETQHHVPVGLFSIDGMHASADEPKQSYIWDSGRSLPFPPKSDVNALTNEPIQNTYKEPRLAQTGHAITKKSSVYDPIQRSTPDRRMLHSQISAHPQTNEKIKNNPTFGMSEQPVQYLNHMDSVDNRFGSNFKKKIPPMKSMNRWSDVQSFRPSPKTFTARCYVATDTGFRRESDCEFVVPKSQYWRGNRRPKNSIRSQSFSNSQANDMEDADIISLGIGPRWTIQSNGIKVYEKFVSAFYNLGELAARRIDELQPIDFNLSYHRSATLMVYWKKYYKCSSEEYKMLAVMLPALQTKCVQYGFTPVSDVLLNYQVSLQRFKQSSLFRILQNTIAECADQNESNSLIELLDECNTAVRQCSVNIFKLRKLLNYSGGSKMQQLMAPTEMMPHEVEITADELETIFDDADASNHRHIG